MSMARLNSIRDRTRVLSTNEKNQASGRSQSRPTRDLKAKIKTERWLRPTLILFLVPHQLQNTMSILQRTLIRQGASALSRQSFHFTKRLAHPIAARTFTTSITAKSESQSRYVAVLLRSTLETRTKKNPIHLRIESSCLEPCPCFLFFVITAHRKLLPPQPLQQLSPRKHRRRS